MEITESSTPLETENLPKSTSVIQPEIKPKGKSLKLPIIVLSLIILVLTGVIGYLLLKQQNDKEADDQENEQTEVEETSDEQEEEIEDENVEEEAVLPTDELDNPSVDDDELTPDEPVVSDEDRIVYIKDYNIWVMNSDGSGKVQITDDASEVIQYRTVDWKEPGIISYSRCDGECSIYTYDLAITTESLVLSGIPFTQSFDAIEWSHDGNSIAYIFTKGDFSKESSIFSGGTTTVLVSYAPPPGRGGHYDDGMEIEFSPDDTKLVVFNTSIDETINMPIMAFRIDGTMIAQLEDATFPTFYGNNAFYYKYSGDMRLWNCLTATSSIVTTFPSISVHDFKTSPDGYFVSFWSDLSEADLRMNYYDTGGSSSTVATNYVEPRWLDDGSVYFVAIKVSDIGVMGMYESGGLSRVKRMDGTTMDLDAGSIYIFEVE